jgi:hypothetical protein
VAFGANTVNRNTLKKRGGESFFRGEAGRGRKIKTRGGAVRGGENFFQDGARRGVKNPSRFGPWPSQCVKNETFFDKSSFFFHSSMIFNKLVSVLDMIVVSVVDEQLSIGSLTRKRRFLQHHK